MTQNRKFWRITGYDSTTQIFEVEVPLGRYSARRMEDLLQALVSRAGLSFGEIVESYAKKNARTYRPLLEIQREATQCRFVLSCGTNPHFLASVIEK